jgi:hypothetical protein
MTAASEARTSPKKARVPRASSMPLRNAIASVAAEYDRMSIRQLYYQLVSRGAIEKTEPAYKRVCDVSAQMRIDGSLDYRKIVDGSDSRHAAFAARYGDASVELDALPPNVLTAMVRTAIQSEIDRKAWAKTQEIEAQERKTFESLALIDWQPGVSYGLKNGEAA